MSVTDDSGGVGEDAGWGLAVMMAAAGKSELDRPTGCSSVSVQQSTLGSGFRDQGSGFRVQGFGFRVHGSGFRALGPEFRAQG